jgi:hypothetical protein
MTAAVFRGTALFVWSRHRGSFALWLAIYALLFIASEALTPEQFRPWLLYALVILVFAPVFLPLAYFVSSVRIGSLDLISPDGQFPRQFFALPVTAYQLVLPFMLYAVLIAATQWLLAAVISRDLGPIVNQLWLPALGTSLIAWIQALVWTPVRHRWVRGAQLLTTLLLYIGVLVLSLNGNISAGVTIALSLIQLPLAYATAVRGVSKARHGEPRSVTKQPDREASPSTIAAPGKLPAFASPLAAQLWMERRTHRWSGTSTLLALIPIVLLLILLLSRLSGAAERNPDALGMLGKAVIYVLLLALGMIGLSSGLNFASFRSRVQWYQADAFVMPPYFAALPLSTADFVWTKITAALTNLLWISLGVLAMCACVAWISGFAESWLSQHAAWREQYGIVPTVALAALPSVLFIMMMLTATASVMWVALLGRFWNWITIAGTLLFAVAVVTLTLAGRYPNGYAARLFPEVLTVLAIAKIGALAALIYYVHSKRLLSASRLAVIAGFWAATVAMLCAWLAWYAPQELVNPLTALCAGIVFAPVLGAVAAPWALHRNRAR